MTIDPGPNRTAPRTPCACPWLRPPDRSVWLDPVQTRLTPAPAHSPGARTYSYQNQDLPRCGARPTAPRPAHNSVPAASAISWRPTPPAPTGRPQKLLCSFFSSVASSDADSACRSSNRDSGKTRCVARRCSQTPLLAAELRLAYVAWVPTTSVLRSSGHLNTDRAPRTGVLVKRLRLSSRFSNAPANFTRSAEGQTVTSWTIGSRPSAR